MKLDHSHLAALAAILREGSFEKAATALNVTPSAISQRIRALEEQMGAVLIIRDTPCRPTKEGEKLYRHAMQIDLLERDLLGDLRQQEQQVIPVAVNADVLATWFVDAIRLFHEETGVMIEAFADNEGYTAEWLREGRVLGAVTSSSKAVQGCKTEKLQAMRYIPMASPSFVKKYFAKGVTREAFEQAPMLVFDRKDRLQHSFIKKVIGKDIANDPPCHWYPSSAAFQDMAAAGLGWGMAPEPLIGEYLRNGTLVNFAPKYAVEVPLYWQSWRLTSPTLEALTRAVKKAAR
jgi:LysR family transcriptional regulator (chromosome initiation inhibitor)